MLNRSNYWYRLVRDFGIEWVYKLRITLVGAVVWVCLKRYSFDGVQSPSINPGMQIGDSQSAGIIESGKASASTAT